MSQGSLLIDDSMALRISFWRFHGRNTFSTAASTRRCVVYRG
jgi:hypothetical protein